MRRRISPTHLIPPHGYYSYDMTGTFVNTAAIILGSLAGVIIRSHLPRKTVNVVFQGIGLFALVLGISMSLKSDNLLLAVVSIVSGTVIGEFLDIEKYVHRFSDSLHNLSHRRPFSGKKPKDRDFRDMSGNQADSRFAEGFITASMIFCVGSMSILGALEEGAGQTPTLLYTKSIMDGVTSLILASSFGIAVIFSCIPVLVYQGGLTIFAAYIMRFMSGQMVADLTAVGGIMLIGMAIDILKIKEIKVINMLPSLLVIVLLSYFWG